MPRGGPDYIDFDRLQLERLLTALQQCAAGESQMNDYDAAFYRDLKRRCENAQEFGIHPLVTQKQFTYLTQLGKDAAAGCLK